MSVVYSAAKTLLCVMCVSSKRRQSRCALVNGVQTCALPIGTPKKIADNEEKGFDNDLTPVSKGVRKNIHARQYHSEKNEFQQGRSLLKALEEVAADRKSVVTGTSVSVSEDIVGRRLITKQT